MSFRLAAVEKITEGSVTVKYDHEEARERAKFKMENVENFTAY